MRTRIIVSALLIAFLSIGFSSNADAGPWRGCRHGWYKPRPVVRVWAPLPAPVIAPRIVAGGYYEPSYYGPAYCAPRYAGPRYYGHGYYGGGYRHNGYYRRDGGYRHEGHEGHYGPRYRR